MKKLRNAFTLMELLVAVMILTIVAAFGIPNYNKSLQRTDEREAVSNLRILAEALEQYKNQNGAYPSFDMPQVTDINNSLHLGIIEQNMDYDCDFGLNPIYRCTAVSSYGWEIQYNTGTKDTVEVYCSVAGCPSCPAVNCSYIGIY